MEELPGDRDIPPPSGDAELKISEALSKMSADDLVSVLRRVPVRSRNAFLADLRLPQLRSVNLTVCRQALQRLRRKPIPFQRKAAAFLAAEVLAGLDVVADDLEEHECDDRELIRDLLSRWFEETPVGVVRLGVAVAIADGHRLATVLAAAREDEELSIGDASTPPGAGARPLKTDARGENGHVAFDPLESALADELGEFLGEDFDEAMNEAPDIVALRKRLADLDLEAVREAADHIREQVYLGARPSESDLDTLNTFATELDDLYDELSKRVGEQIAEVSVAGLANAIELVAAHGRPDERTVLLRRLANIEGPDALVQLLGEVRSAVTAHLSGPHDEPEAEALLALAEIVELAATDDVDDERLLVLDERVRARLPVALHPVLVPAARGRLRLPPAADAEPAPASQTPPASDSPVLLAAVDSAKDASLWEAPAPTNHASDHPASDVAGTGPSEAKAPGSNDDHAAENSIKDDHTADSAGKSGDDAATETSTDDLGVVEHSPVGPTVTAASDVSPGTGEPVQGDETHEPEPRWASDERVRQAAAGLVAEGRLGLLSWLAEAAGAPGGIVAALRAAAYGDAMRTPTGQCAGRLSEFANDIKLRDLEEWPARLLVFVSAVRGALLAPFSGATQLLDEVAPAFASWPELTVVAETVAQGAVRGLQIVNASDAAMASVAAVEAEVAAAVELAAENLRAGPTRTIKFQRATDLWHDWIAPNGLLGSLLEAVAADRRAERDAIARRVVELRSPRALDKLLDDADRRHRKKTARTPIVAGARARLLERAGEVLDQVSAWLDAIDRLEGLGASGDGSDWRQAPIAELRDQLLPHKEGALAALRAWNPDGDPLAAAAAEAARRSLEATFALFDGIPLPGDEPPAEHVTNQELLKVTEVNLDGLTPRADLPLDGLLAVAGGREWVEAFEQREAIGDHAGTAHIVEAMRDRDPSLAAQLARRRDDAKRADGERLRTEVSDLRDDLARARRQGYLDDDAWSDLATRLETVVTNQRQDFGELRRELGALLSDLNRRRAEARTRAFERLADLRAGSDSIGAVGDRIEALIRDGHLATADEFLALVQSGEEPPTGDSKSNLLEELWPAVVDALAARPLDASVADAAAAGEMWQGIVDFAPLSATRRELASRALRAWIIYGEGRRSGRYLPGLRDVLALAGIEADNETFPSELRSGDQRRWVDLTGVRRIGKALVPSFGTLSGGSSGDSLRLLLTWGQPSTASLAQVVAHDTSHRPVFVLYFGLLPAAERRALVDHTRRRRATPVAVFDDAVVTFLASRTESRFDTMMCTVLPFTAINPYTPRVAGDVPLEMFYGRTDEIHEIIEPLGTSFIYGGRQLGKSSLLRAAARRFDNGMTQRALYIDLKREGVGRTRRPEDVWDVLWDHLAEASVVTGKKPQPRELPERLLSGVRHWLDARPDRRILLLLDECDDFLEADAAQLFPTVSRLKGLLEDTGRRCKPVFAGLHQVQRFQYIPNQPLAHLGRPVSVGPLRPKAAFDLLDAPMRALGYRFASDELVNRILAYCNNQPSLLQLFGEALVNHLVQAPVPPGAPPYVVNEGDVESAYASRALTEEFRHRFELTLQLDLRYKVIAYAMAYNAHEMGPATVADPAELRSDCEKWWPKGFAGMPSDEFRALLGEMVGLGVLSEVDGGFRMRSPNVLRMLGTSDQIVSRLLDAETYPLPEPFQAASFRRPLGTGTQRSPLNEAQLAELLMRRNQCLLVAASAALGLPDVATAVKGAAPREDSVSSIMVRGRTIPAASARPVAGKHRLVIADMTAVDAAATAAAIASAREAVAQAAGGTLGIVAVTAPRHAAVWADLASPGRSSADAVRVIELRRWDLAGLRMWMRDTELPFQDEDARRVLLEVTGGWPILVDEVVSLVASGENHRPHVALDRLAERLAGERGADELVAATGVSAQPELASVWGGLVDFDEPAFHDELVELLHDEAGERTTLLIDVLRMLGALATTADGRLSCEPILAAAWRGRSESLR